MEQIARFWDNKLSNIDGWECFIYDRMTDTDKNRKNKINHRYHRYYNDGDFPRGLKNENGDPICKWMENTTTGRRIVETALEKTVEDNARYMIKKYMTPENRREFYKDEYLTYKTNILTDVRKWDGFAWWLGKNRVIKRIWDAEGFKELFKRYVEAQDAIRDFAGKKNLSVFYIIDNFDVPEDLMEEMADAAEEIDGFLKKEFSKIEKQYGYFGVK